MKTLLDYINDNRQIVYSIETYVNSKNNTNIFDSDTRTINFTQTGLSQCNVSNYNKLNQTLLNTVPLKVYLFDNDTYNTVIHKDLIDEGIPADKKNLLAIFDNNILKENIIE